MAKRLTRRRFLRAGGVALAAGYALGARLSVPRAVAATPQTSYAVPGLAAPGEILVDRWGIPHLYASSQPDVFFLQGFNAARDRLWQIDLWRRRGLGRLSAAFGPSYLEQDRAARLFLYRGDIAAEWRAYADDAEAIAGAFTAGVNAYVELVERGEVPLPVEFATLGYAPERWAPEDVVRIRSHGLVDNVASEVARALVLRDFGGEAEGLRRRLEPPWEFQVPDGLDLGVIPDGVLDVYDLATQAVEFSAEANAARLAGAAAASARARRLGSIGSNNWAISGTRTASGRPILANDPHRTQGVPSLRYLAHLVAPGLDVIGAGEPALPGISIGHNESVAFGLTIFAIDQEDLYVYETRPGSPQEYRYGDGWETMRVVQEAVPVRGAADETVTLRFTRHGPVVAADEQKRSAFAVRSVWFEPGTSAYFASIAYMRAGNWDEFVAGLRRWGAPGENQVYADRSGHIGWKPCGLTPVRPNWDGLLPVPGDGRYEWAGFLDPDELPVEFDPQRGWVATANAENLPDDYPYRERKIGFEWAAPFRLQRIVSVLRRRRRSSLADSRRLQVDHRSIPATRVVPLLAGLAPQDPRLARAIALLGDWDYELSPGSAAAALFEVWNSIELPRALLRAALGSEDAVDAVWPGDPVVLLALLERPDDRLGAQPRETRDRVLAESLGRAVARTEELLGPDWSRWAWGRLHVARFEHPLSPVVGPELERKLNVGPVPVGGGGETVGDTGYSTGPPPDDVEGLREWFRVASGASFRQLIDVGGWDRSETINNPGQSGDPDSPHYRDLIELWAAGRTVPMLYSRRRVERAAERRIVLQPTP
jgi:penicillin amidase